MDEDLFYFYESQETTALAVEMYQELLKYNN